MNRRPLIVWGNCQAPPIAELIAAPLREVGIDVVPVPAVYLISAAELARVRALLPTAAALVAQPVRDDYRLSGCGTDQLVDLLPPDADVVTFPIVFDVGRFPYQAHGHDAHGGRVDAPMTDYHDLRTLVAAARGLDVDTALAAWPVPDPDTIRAAADEAGSELRRRESGLTVATADLIEGPDALWTMTHPANTVLIDIARRILHALGHPGDVQPPAVEFLGQRRTPVEAAVRETFGWLPAAREEQQWQIDGRAVPLRDIVDRQLRFYADRPDVVAASLERSARRIELLRLPVVD